MLLLLFQKCLLHEKKLNKVENDQKDTKQMFFDLTKWQTTNVEIKLFGRSVVIDTFYTLCASVRQIKVQRYQGWSSGFFLCITGGSVGLHHISFSSNSFVFTKQVTFRWFHRFSRFDSNSVSTSPFLFSFSFSFSSPPSSSSSSSFSPLFLSPVS